MSYTTILGSSKAPTPTDKIVISIKPVGADSIYALFSSGAYRMLPYRQNIKIPPKPVGVGALDNPNKICRGDPSPTDEY